MEQLWLFEDPKNVAVITTYNIMTRISPILYVSHDEADGMWQFLEGGDVSEKDARILSLEEVINIEPNLAKLADLPVGWSAWRKSVNKQWIRVKK